LHFKSYSEYLKGLQPKEEKPPIPQPLLPSKLYEQLNPTLRPNSIIGITNKNTSQSIYKNILNELSKNIPHK